MQESPKTTAYRHYYLGYLTLYKVLLSKKFSPFEQQIIDIS